MSVAEEVRGLVRLAILRTLAVETKYSQNQQILRRAIFSQTAVDVTESDLLSHLSWMEDQKLITTEKLGKFTMAKLDDLGLKIVQGDEIVEGVARPDPSDL